MRLRIKGRGRMVLLGKMDGILNGTSPQEGRQDLVPKEGRQDLVIRVILFERRRGCRIAS